VLLTDASTLKNVCVKHLRHVCGANRCVHIISAENAHTHTHTHTHMHLHIHAQTHMLTTYNTHVPLGCRGAQWVVDHLWEGPGHLQACPFLGICVGLARTRHL